MSWTSFIIIRKQLFYSMNIIASYIISVIIYQVLYNYFPKYHMKILLGDLNAKVGRENIFKPTIGQDSLHQDSNDIGVRLNFNFVLPCIIV